MKLYRKSYWLYTVKDFIWYLFSLYYFCFTCLKLAKPKVQLKSVLMILTLNGLFQKYFQVFYFTPENSISLILSLPPQFVFFHYSVCTLISDCNHPFDTSTFTHTVSQEYTLLQLKIHIWMEFFWSQKFLFFHKRNFNPKVINYF